MKHPESLVNFIAAYGTHATILAATTLEDKRAAAMDLVFGGPGAPADRLEFLNSTGAWANGANGVRSPASTMSTSGSAAWPKKMPFGGMLGSTFNFVFEIQIEAAGRRPALLPAPHGGTQFLAELENNSFAKLIMANTDATHFPGILFTTPGLILEVDPAKQFNGDRAAPIRSATIRLRRSSFGTTRRRRAGHELPCATPATSMSCSAAPRGNDILIASEGDDTIWGDGGNDRKLP